MCDLGVVDFSELTGLTEVYAGQVLGMRIFSHPTSLLDLDESSCCQSPATASQSSWHRKRPPSRSSKTSPPVVHISLLYLLPPRSQLQAFANFLISLHRSQNPHLGSRLPPDLPHDPQAAHAPHGPRRAQAMEGSLLRTMDVRPPRAAAEPLRRARRASVHDPPGVCDAVACGFLGDDERAMDAD